MTAVTYGGALLIERKGAFGQKKYLISIGAVLTLLPLLVFKYYNFLSTTACDILSSLGLAASMPGLNWAVPLGLSFFTFQALGYLWDVYYRRIEAEHNWWDYMLFVSFFPQIASGPISKARDLLPQIKKARQFDYARAVEGCKWLLWGMFMKLVLADQAGLVVDTILPRYAEQGSATVLMGCVLYSFQIYADFAGYSWMAIGVGRLMGFDLVNNFRRPYLAASVTEFWRRWHISLTRWLTDYVYIPLGGNRKGKLRTYLNIFVTFLVSGIWHGASFTFIVWGMLHGAVQVLEKALGIQKCERAAWRWVRIPLVFCVVTFAWVFFRMPTLGDACGVVARIFEMDGFSALNGKGSALLFSFMAIGVVAVKGLCEEFFPSVTLWSHRCWLVRWCTYLVLACTTLLGGVLDAGTFIYVNF